MWLRMAKVRGGARLQAENRFPTAQGHVDSPGICTRNGSRVMSGTSLSESLELQGPRP